MTASARAWLLAGAQLLLLLGVTGKLAWDRQTLPRVWARSVPVDPDDPLRGRYVRLWLAAEDRTGRLDGPVALDVDQGRLVAHPPDGWPGLQRFPGATVRESEVVLARPVAFFLPEHVPDPSRLEAGQELWVEVTVPPRGLPRPIRLELRSPQSP